MTFLSTADLTTLLGNGPKVVSKKPMMRTQGNGHLTGLIVTTYDDGSTSQRDFIVNARSREEVVAAYATCGE